MVSFRFVKWCRTAVSRIVLPRDRTGVERELMDHLEDQYEYFRQLGYGKDDAEILSLDAMGDSEVIARELGRIHRPFWGRTAKVTKILLIGILCLTLFAFGASLLKNFYFRPAFSFPTYESYHPYTSDSAVYSAGQAQRQVYTEPNAGFASDGYKVILTKAALWQNSQRNSAGITEESHPLYVQLKVHNFRIWAEEDQVIRWLRAADSAGNQYASPYESAPGTNRIHVKSYRVSPWTTVHELVIRDITAPESAWVDLHYTRSGRDRTLRIDLSEGDIS